jgi:hypothetical protein
MRLVGHVAHMVEVRNTFLFKSMKGRDKHSWEDNIRIDLREIWWQVVDWVNLSQDSDQWTALVNMEMNLQFP